MVLHFVSGTYQPSPRREANVNASSHNYNIAFCQAMSLSFPVGAGGEGDVHSADQFP